MRVKKEFFRYVSLNILGMIGMSCYFLADTYFISKAQGSNGITALNLVLPVYGLIFAIGAMISVGSAIKYSVAKSAKQSDADAYFFNAVFFSTLAGLVFSVIGLIAPDRVLILMGADEVIVKTGVEYTKIFMSFAPAFMWGQLANAFVRNDGSPAIAMLSTLCSSLFNIVFDYVLIFPLGMGMKGAALATSLSPVLGVLICMTHFLSKRCRISFKISLPSVKKLLLACQVGISAFVGELSSGIITMVFNFIILYLAGNTAVAAYGIIANVSLVAVAVFNGVANGSQPLISYNYGAENNKNVKSLRSLSFFTSLFLALLLYVSIFFGTDTLISIFNSENNSELYAYAHTGIRLYFTGIFFAGANIAGSSFFSATEKAKNASIISVLRGLVLIVIFAFALSKAFGLNGVWLSYAAGEAVTTIVMIVLMIRSRKERA